MWIFPTRFPRTLPRALRPVAFLVAAGTLLGATAGAAETRIFLIENSDAYGIDTCLADGQPCGVEAANAWCRTHSYTQALDYGRVNLGTGSGRGIMTIAGGEARAPACTGAGCPAVVAISCTR